MASRRRVTRIRNMLIIVALIALVYLIHEKLTDVILKARTPIAVTSRESPTQHSGTHDSGGKCSKKNVLLIISDDLRPQLGAYAGEDFPELRNAPKMRTPHLDKLAKRSLLMTRAYSQISSCGPSRSSFLTSRRPDTTKVWDLKTYWRHSGGNFTTLPQYFKDHGYLTAGTGKVFHPELSSNYDDPISWTEPYYHPPNMPRWSYVFTVGVSWKAVTKKERKEAPLEDEQTANETLHVLRRLAPGALSCQQPFFLAAGFHKPHLPFVFPEEFLKYYPLKDMDEPANYHAPSRMPDIAWQDFPELRRFTDLRKLKHDGGINVTFSGKVTRDLRRAYYASVSYVDALVGKLLRELEKLGLSDNTVVSFIGDHGFHLGDNGQWAKHSNFEQGVHTPVMVHVPGSTDIGVRSRSLAELVDVYPTLAEAAGLPRLPACPRNSTDIPACTEGTSLIPLINDPNLELREAAFSQHRRVGLKMGYTMRTDRYRYTEWIQYDRAWNLNDNWDYRIMWDKPIATELYDHVTDPEENWNLSGLRDYDEICSEMKSKIREFFTESILDVRRLQPTLGLKEDTRDSITDT